MMLDSELSGLEYLLELHGSVVYLDNDKSGYWWKIEAWIVPETKAIPHGIKYRLTLHDKYNQRLMGYDNAHLVKVNKKRVVGMKKAYDHKHRTSHDKGIPYDFESPAQLLEDFFKSIDETIEKIEGNKL